jgi:hypothetical protein
MIFLSYRRGDAGGVAGRIFDRLVGEYGLQSVFMDVHSIPAGVDFREGINAALLDCKVMLIIIGQHWRGASDRINDSGDFVRLEIETGLRRGVRMIPVLIDDTAMPAPEALPPRIAELASRQAASVRSTSFDSDIKMLVRAIGERLEEKTGIADQVRDMRRHFLSAPPKDELIRVKYRLDGYVAKNPGDVDARILQDQIVQAIAYEMRAGKIHTSPVVASKFAARSGWVAITASVLVAIGIASTYFLESPAVSPAPPDARTVTRVCFGNGGGNNCLNGANASFSCAVYRSWGGGGQETAKNLGLNFCSKTSKGTKKQMPYDVTLYQNNDGGECGWTGFVVTCNP